MAKFSLSIKIGVLKTVSDSKKLTAAGNYDIEDVLSESASRGTPWEFEVARSNGGSGQIIQAQALWQTTALSPILTLYLFTAKPTSVLNDNVANTGPSYADRAIYIGKIDFVALEDLGGMSEAIVTPSTYGNLPVIFKCAAGTKKIYGILVTRSAITGEAAGEELIVELTVEQY